MEWWTNLLYQSDPFWSLKVKLWHSLNSKQWLYKEVLPTHIDANVLVTCWEKLWYKTCLQRKTLGRSEVSFNCSEDLVCRRELPESSLRSENVSTFSFWELSLEDYQGRKIHYKYNCHYRLHAHYWDLRNVCLILCRNNSPLDLVYLNMDDFKSPIWISKFLAVNPHCCCVGTKHCLNQ